jgi:hypothetical protein
MAAGTSFVCGKCRNVLEVPQAGPVVQPISPAAGGGPAKGSMKPPPTVSMTPDQVRKALKESAAVGAERTTPPAQPQQQRKLPKAMQKRAQESASQSAQRAGATGQLPATQAAPAQGKSTSKGGSRKSRSASGAKASSASSRSSSRGASSGGSKKKSQTGLYAGIGIAAVVVIAIIAFVATRGGGDGETGPAGGGQETAAGNGGGDASTGTGGGSGSGDAGTANAGAGGTSTAGSGGASTAIDPSDTVGLFLAMTPQKQKEEYARKVAGASGSTDALHSLFEFFSDERMATNSVAKEARKTIADTALRLDSKLEWANEASGRKNLRDYLRACRDECPKAFGFAEDDENQVLDRLAALEDGSPWVESTEFRDFSKIVDRIRAREEELKESPRLVAVEKQKDWVRKNDLFKDFEIIARHEDPYVVFQQYPKLGEGMERYDEQRLKKARHLAKRDGIIFRELNRRFRELFGTRFELPKLADKGRLLRVLIMWDRKHFDEWHAKQNSGMSGLIRAYYSPAERHIVHYVGTEALTEQDFFMAANGRIQKKSDQVTFHEGTHQLMHEYSAIYRGSPLPEDPGAEVEVPPRKSMWFDEGLAEFIGAVEIDEGDMQDLGGDFYHGRVLLERIGLSRHVRRNYPDQKWSLAKMLLPNHNGDMMQMGGEVIPGRPDLAANLFYAQAWAFVHFCFNYDNGKYKQQFLNYMETVLKGTHGPESVAKAFGLPNAEDFGDIEKEYDWYYNLLLRRVPGKKSNGTWRTPDTDPPQGTWSPDGSEDDGDDYDSGGDDYDSE